MSERSIVLKENYAVHYPVSEAWVNSRGVSQRRCGDVTRTDLCTETLVVGGKLLFSCFLFKTHSFQELFNMYRDLLKCFAALLALQTVISAATPAQQPWFSRRRLRGADEFPRGLPTPGDVTDGSP